MKRFVAAALVIALFGVAGGARADDKPKDDTSKLVGTWKLSIRRGEQTIDGTLELKMEGDKLTGTMTGRNGRDQKFDEVSFKNGEISFSFTRERNRQKRVTKFSGKVTGDTMKGKTEGAEWEAKRVKKGT